MLNEAWLQGYKFYVDERVIIPRSFIAELLKDDLHPWVQDVAAVTDVLDLCTGSGCLAIIAADLFPNAKIDAIDSSPEALLVAARNVTDYQLDDRVTLIKSDMFAGVASKRYDVILCNPPYVTDAAMAKLPKEYAHEPKVALGRRSRRHAAGENDRAPGARTSEARRGAHCRGGRWACRGGKSIWRHPVDVARRPARATTWCSSHGRKSFSSPCCA